MATARGQASDGALSADSNGISSQHAKRRACQQAARQAADGRLQSAFKRIREIELQLVLEQPSAAAGATSWPKEVIDRLLVIAPAIAAQLEAEAAGLPSHTSAGLLPRDEHVLAGAAKHFFQTLD